MAMSCTEHLEFQSPVGFADGAFSEPAADVGLLLRRRRLRSVGHMELSGGKWWWSRGVDELWFRTVIPPRPVRRGSHGTRAARALLTLETTTLY